MGMKRGQSLIDYVMIFGIVAAALVGMARFMGRTVRAHVAKTSDELGYQEASMEKVTDIVVVQDDSTMFSQDASTTVAKEALGGARYTSYDDTMQGWGNSTLITEEAIE